MRVVIDCNVLVSAARIDGVCRKVIGEVVVQPKHGLHLNGADREQGVDAG